MASRRLKRSPRISKSTPRRMARQASTLTQTGTAAARQSANLATKTAMRRAAQVAATVEDVAEDIVNLSVNRELAVKLLDAVKYAVDMWKLQAHFQNVRIFAIAATGAPGCLDGPDLEGQISNAPMVVSLEGAEAELRDAVAEGVADCFSAWQEDVTVPGLPWYPAFAAFPGPAAPPMPNIPSPLIACVSASVSKIMVASELTSAMVDALPDALRDPTVEAALAAIGNSLALAFSVWIASAQVMLVMGKGPIPSFAPPYVPVGPVVGGDVIESPGHLASAPSLSIVLPPGVI